MSGNLWITAGKPYEKLSNYELLQQQYSQACGNGLCELGEDGTDCPSDCCDADTPCDVSYRNYGTHWCRSLSRDVQLNTYAWVTESDVLPYCDDSSDVGVSWGMCDGETYCCVDPPYWDWCTL